jgi:hypothetical protein
MHEKLQTNLTPNLAATFLEMCDFPVPQLIETLNLYGELNVSAGCKTRLLLQMKQLLIDQSALQRGKSILSEFFVAQLRNDIISIV